MSRRKLQTAARASLAGVLLSVAWTVPALADTTPLGDTKIHETVESRTTCENPLIVNPFRPFGDSRDYVLAPGGTFARTSPAGWQLSGGAEVVRSDASHGTSLALPRGGSAITPAMCIDLNYPIFRFVSRVLRYPDDAELRIEAVYPNAPNPAFEELKKFDGKQGRKVGGGWRLSDDIDLKPDLGGKAAGPRLVALRFTAIEARAGDRWEIDDIYVDPLRR